MEELPIEKKQIDVTVTKNDFRATEAFDILLDSFGNPNESSDEEAAPKTRNARSKKRDKCFSESDTDSGREKTKNGELPMSENSLMLESTMLGNNSENDASISKRFPHKSRIKINTNLSDSGSDTAMKNEEQQFRITNKRKKLKDKFKSLVTSRRKEPPSPSNFDDERKSINEPDEDMASIQMIKQKIKERMSFMPSICDPDSSDEENSLQKTVYKQKKERKRTQLTSPKPQRMSAKQAMENMQKIKSESNRMLREKEVSLPYHRPKALSLKDIMSRKKLAVSSDGKALPIKMNGEQLKQYAQMLEERQKEMMELCKSESEEEENNESPIEVNSKIAANEESNTNPEETISTENGTISDLNNYVNDALLNQDTHTENVGCDCLDVSLNDDQLPKEQDSISNMAYNDSVNFVIDDKLPTDKEATVLDTDDKISIIPKTIEKELFSNKNLCQIEIVDKNEDSLINNTEAEVDSQLKSLYFGVENTDKTIEPVVKEITTKSIKNNVANTENNLEDQKVESSEDDFINNELSDDDINLEDIDNIIENAEIIKDIEDKVNSQLLVRDKPLNVNPKLTGAPGMVIDLDGGGPEPKKTGVELLRERFAYFSNLKTPEQLEREREKKLKPGTQLKKLKQELEEKIAEQRSLEWAKRLEDEKQQQKELQVLRGEESDEDDIDKIEAAIEGKEEVNEEPEKSESEEESIEDDVVIKDKPRVKNAMVDDEAEESECDEAKNDNGEDDCDQNEEDDGVDADDDDEENESETEESESSESEEEQVNTKKGRILKAFEDSDDEDATKSNHSTIEIKKVKEGNESKNGSKIETFMENQVASQDEELQLAQRQKSMSDDLFTSQESDLIVSEKQKTFLESDEAFTQTFSILDSSKQAPEIGLDSSSKLSGACTTQSLEVGSLEDISTMCPVTTDSQDNLPLPSQIPTTQSSQSQPIGEDIVALCTGQFYNNQFISQVEENQIPLGESLKYDSCDDYPSQESQEENINEPATYIDIGKEKVSVTENIEINENENFIELNGLDDQERSKVVDDNLKSILDELRDPEFNAPKPNKFFANKNIENVQKNEAQAKKRLFIDSDDETNVAEATDTKKRKKLKKKKFEKRALQFSDDDEELSEVEEIESNESDIEEDNPDRLVEYDSEENEIEIKPQNPKKRRKMAEFFENEAELTSEDEWAGSGDEDEAGLDRMEREEGDDDKFHQGKLQRELEQIHMRDVLDQDKREVRLIQELLFEDGDLGAGSRQRKFRWNNIDGEVETGTVPDEFADTQEEEAESEEQWRKQRHEREMFLKQMKNKEDPDEGLNVSISRSTRIKANLLSNTVSSLLMDANNSNVEKTESPPVEKKTAKDIPSPKKPFAMMQQSYQGSLLSRGRGALARLAALATPLAADDDTVGTLGPTSRRNFVFAAITPDEKAPKVTKRKAESNLSTPNLLKKMRKVDKQYTSKNSLLDHFKL